MIEQIIWINEPETLFEKIKWFLFKKPEPIYKTLYELMKEQNEIYSRLVDDCSGVSEVMMGPRPDTPLEIARGMPYPRHAKINDKFVAESQSNHTSYMKDFEGWIKLKTDEINKRNCLHLEGHIYRADKTKTCVLCWEAI